MQKNPGSFKVFFFMKEGEYSDEAERIHYTTCIFSAGEVHVELGENQTGRGDELAICEIVANIRSATDLLELMLLVDALRRLPDWEGRIFLTLPYVPYGRADRYMNPGEAFGLKVFADIINSRGFHEVHILDPHSSVTPALIDRCVVYPQGFFYVGSDLGVTDTTILLAPDAGAVNKVKTLAQITGLRYAHADKTRDTTTGQLSAPHVYLPPELSLVDAHVIICDDILDGGGTFLALLPILKDLGASKVDLFISHGIFSKGLKCLEGFHKVFILNSFIPTEYFEGTNIVKLKGLGDD